MTPRSVAVYTREIVSPIPPNASLGYGTSIVVVPGTTEVLLSWIEGAAAYRLGRWDVGTGEWEAIPTFGMLRERFETS